jgi:hypothetical protein
MPELTTIERLRELLEKVHEAPLLYDTCVIASAAWRDGNGLINYEAYGGPLAEGDPRTLRLCVAAVNALPALLEVVEAAHDARAVLDLLRMGLDDISARAEVQRKLSKALEGLNKEKA